VQDVAYRAIAAQQKPDHTTIARFRARHEDELAELFSSVLGLCKEAGLVKVGVVAIDGTKVHANASHHCNVDYDQLAREILSHGGPQLCFGDVPHRSPLPLDELRRCLRCRRFGWISPGNLS
jgi:hypothetical protein